jgi:hypothetical protein
MRPHVRCKKRSATERKVRKHDNTRKNTDFKEKLRAFQTFKIFFCAGGRILYA